MHACEFVHRPSYAACDVCIMACHGRKWPLPEAEGSELRGSGVHHGIPWPQLAFARG